MGSVSVQHVEAGRGLVATRDIEVGELLLLCRPIALATGPPGASLQPSQIVPQLAAHLAAGTAAATGLCSTSSSSAADTPLPDLAALADCPPITPSTASTASNSSRLVLKGAQQRAALNAYGEPHNDVAAATCRWNPEGKGALRVSSVMGVWPAMALINHR